MKPAVRSALAEADIKSTLAFYAVESMQLALEFIDALEHATQHIETHPATGLPRYSHALNIPQLRCWPLRKFPFALFYIEHGTNLDVIRLVHLHRDIPASLRDDPP